MQSRMLRGFPGGSSKGSRIVCVRFINFAGNAQQWLSNRTSSRVFRGDRKFNQLASYSDLKEGGNHPMAEHCFCSGSM